MTLFSCEYSNISQPFQTYSSTFVEYSEPWNKASVTYFQESRLVQSSSRSICLIPKTPSEVIGEKILRPIIDVISTWASKIFSLATYIPSLPGASASEIGIGNDSDFFPSEEVLLSYFESNHFTTNFGEFSEASQRCRSFLERGSTSQEH